MKPPSERARAAEQVAQADVGEGAAHHDLVVAAPRAVGVEVRGLDAVLLEVASGRAVALDRPGRGDVVGGDRVAEQREHARAGDVGDGAAGSARPSKNGGRRT